MFNFFKKRSIKSRVVSTICSSEEFLSMVARERSRTRRSKQKFSLLIFKLEDLELERPFGRQLIKIIGNRLRATDEVGWLDDNHIGIFLYDAGASIAYDVAKDIASKMSSFDPIDYEIQTYPEESKEVPDKQTSGGEKKIERGMAGQARTLRPLFVLAMPRWKRYIDIFVSVLALIIFSPILILAVLVIKILSPGPLFFKQERVGYSGEVFNMWKFRTMEVDVDTSRHQAHLSDSIASSDKPMFKLDKDNPKIIPFGRFLRSSSIDELPQLFNVLKGEMSLVGPRPPICYEVEEYVRWHTGRFDAVPGMTGLWQVMGKNKLSFKAMARLDIRYSKQMSFLLDMKILSKTPFVVLFQIRT